MIPPISFKSFNYFLAQKQNSRSIDHRPMRRDSAIPSCLALPHPVPACPSLSQPALPCWTPGPWIPPSPTGQPTGQWASFTLAFFEPKTNPTHGHPASPLAGWCGALPCRGAHSGPGKMPASLRRDSPRLIVPAVRPRGGLLAHLADKEMVIRRTCAEHGKQPGTWARTTPSARS